MKTPPFSWTPDRLHWLKRSVLCWLATANAEGQPNVSPKEVFEPWEQDQLLIAHIASPISVHNIGLQSQVCISCLDVFAQKGLKLQGVATMVWPDDPTFASLAAPLKALIGERFSLKGVIRVHVQECRPILAPSYLLIPETTKSEQIRAAWHSYTMRLPDSEVLPSLKSPLSDKETP
jgi:hypothetical protein